MDGEMMTGKTEEMNKIANTYFSTMQYVIKKPQ